MADPEIMMLDSFIILFDGWRWKSVEWRKVYERTSIKKVGISRIHDFVLWTLDSRLRKIPFGDTSEDKTNFILQAE